MTVDEMTASRDDEAREGRPVGTAPPRDRCLDCRYRMTWAAERRQYGRALRRGLTPEGAKAAMPRCQKCMTKYLAYDLVRAEGS